MNKRQANYARKTISACAKLWELSAFDLLRASRKADIVMARDAAIYTIKRGSKLSNQAIAEILGKDVSTITYSLRRTGQRFRTNTFDNQAFLEKLERIRMNLKLPTNS